MATDYKRLGALTSAGVIGTADTLYACGVDSSVVSTVAVTNRAATSATYRVAVSTATTFQDAGYLVYEATVPANDTIFLTLGATLDGTNKYLLCSASAVTVSFSAFGVENSIVASPATDVRWLAGISIGATFTVPAGAVSGDLIAWHGRACFLPQQVYDDLIFGTTGGSPSNPGQSSTAIWAHDGRAAYTMNVAASGDPYQTWVVIRRNRSSIDLTDPNWWQGGNYDFMFDGVGWGVGSFGTDPWGVGELGKPIPIGALLASEYPDPPNDGSFTLSANERAHCFTIWHAWQSDNPNPDPAEESTMGWMVDNSTAATNSVGDTVWVSPLSHAGDAYTTVDHPYPGEVWPNGYGEGLHMFVKSDIP